MKHINELPQETQSYLREMIASSQEFIKKMEAVNIQEGKYLAVFETTMHPVGLGSDGTIVHTDDNEPQDFETALNYSRRVINGHGKSPIVMSHAEYISKCIKQQQDSIGFITSNISFA